MNKRTKVILIVISFCILLGINFFMFRNDSNNSELSIDKNERKVNLMKVEKSCFFRKDEKTINIKSDEVSKDNTTNKMNISMDGNKLITNIRLKVYDDHDELLLDKEYSGESVQIEYKIKDKSTFRLELQYTEEIPDDDYVFARVVWYVNDIP